MRKRSRILLPVVVLAACALVAFFLVKTAPAPRRHALPPVVPVVDVLEVGWSDYQVVVHASGTLKPHIQSDLVAEAAGSVVYVSPHFTNGGFIEPDELLIGLDPAEYQYAIANAEAALSGVKARLLELDATARNLEKSMEIERQQLALAERQFRRQGKLRKQGTVSQSDLDQSERELLLRRASLQGLENSLALIPAQRRVLQAEQKLNEARLATARLDLSRTRIRAPYRGRVLEKRVDLGQSVSRGAVLATLYAVDYVEVRLPVSDREAAFLTLPEGRQGDPQPEVILSLSIAGEDYRWRGRIMRTEGRVDARTRQRFLIAQVDHPYARAADDRPSLMVGQYVEAEIPGRWLHDVVVLPRSVVRADDEVLVITPDDRIDRRKLDVVWRDRDRVVVRAGLRAGERVSLTQLPYAPQGARVRINAVADPLSRAAAKDAPSPGAQ